jgi:hypothetical protein
MPDFSLGFGNLYGRFAGKEKQPERRSSGGGQSSFSDRDPTPKPIGGPIAGLGQAAVSTGLDIFGKFYEGGRQVSGDVQDISGKTQEAIGKAGSAIVGAPSTVVSGVTQPVGQLSRDILPLAAVAAAVLLLR